MYLKLLLFLITAISHIEVIALQDAPLRWGYVDFAPYHSGQNGEVVGEIAEKVSHIFNLAELSYVAQELPNKRAKMYIDQGKADFTTVIESFIRKPEQFLKSSHPVYNITLGATCANDDYQITRIDHLKGIPLILISGYTYGNEGLFDREQGFNITMTVQNHEDAIKALTFNRGQCVLGYQSPFKVERLKYPKFNFYFYKINQLPVYLFLNKNVSNAESIMQQINRHNY